ncbi:hypothetical protein HK105_207718 [Polyrhizophydium stewartii]|uniref:Transmembrane protein n=1 Tax=Polyrhizophydium stewartii TaxID=2732419 RepID=A0ABR4MZZ0_9FUNG
MLRRRALGDATASAAAAAASSTAGSTKNATATGVIAAGTAPTVDGATGTSVTAAMPTDSSGTGASTAAGDGAGGARPTFQDTFSPTPTATSTPLNSTAPEAGLSSSAKAAVITMSVFVAVAVVGIYLFRKVTLRPSGRFKARIRSTASSHDEETASRSGSTSRAAEDFALHRVAPSPMPGSVRPPVVAMTSAPGMPAVAAPRVEMYQWPAQQYDTSSVAGSAVGYPHAYDYTPEHGSLDGRYAKRPL